MSSRAHKGGGVGSNQYQTKGSRKHRAGSGANVKNLTEAAVASSPSMSLSGGAVVETVRSVTDGDVPLRINGSRRGPDGAGWGRENLLASDDFDALNNQVGFHFADLYIADNEDGTAAVIEVVTGIQCDMDSVTQGLSDDELEAFDENDPNTWSMYSMWATEQTSVCDAVWDHQEDGWDMGEMQVTKSEKLNRYNETYAELRNTCAQHAARDKRHHFA